MNSSDTPTFAPQSYTRGDYVISTDPAVLDVDAIYAYLCDVYILEEHRGQALGKWLVETVVAYPAICAQANLPTDLTPALTAVLLPVATYATDYLLVKDEQIAVACAALRAARHTVME